MGNAIPTTTDDDDGAKSPMTVASFEANLPESPKSSPRNDASFEAIRRMAQLEVMIQIENIIQGIIQGVDEKKVINVTIIRDAVEEIDNRWGRKFDYDAKDLLRLIHDRINTDKIKQFTTPELTDDQVDKIKTNMWDIAEEVPQARAAAKERERARLARLIADGWTINPNGVLESPRDWRGGSKKKRRTCKKLKAKQRTTTRALLKKWKKNEIKENNKKIRK